MVGFALLLTTSGTVWAAEVRDGPEAPSVAAADRRAAQGGRGLVVWTPADVAGWSGTGLRGAEVVGLGGDESTLWVATAAGGLAAWDGRAWRHAGRRTPVATERLLGLAVVGRDRWVATEGGVLRIDESGRVTPDDAGPLAPDGRVRLPQSVLDTHPDAVGAVARAGGWWVASPSEGLVAWVEGRSEVAWRPPAPAHALLRLDDHLALVTDTGDLWRYTPEGPRPVGRADGLPGEARCLAEGPAPSKVWVGTRRGVALLSRDGAVTTLPLAPLPAGIDVVALAGGSDGVLAAAVDGVAWVGRRAPAGMDALVAAVGPVGSPGSPPDVARVGGTWWAARDSSLLSLDPGGRLVRWDAGAPVVGLDPVPGGLAVRTAAATRFWAPGATQLSPRWDDAPPPGPTNAVLTREAAWQTDGTVLTRVEGASAEAVDLATWLPVARVNAVVGGSRAVWVATSVGLFRVASVGEGDRR
jgi:hypothetical protein